MATKEIVQPTPTYSDSLPVPVDIRRVTEFVEFARWFARPSDEREPENQKKFAELIRVDEDTLTAWKKRAEFWALVHEFLREWMRDRTPDVIASLYGKILSDKCSAGDVKLFLALSEGVPLKPIKQNNL